MYAILILAAEHPEHPPGVHGLQVTNSEVKIRNLYNDTNAQPRRWQDPTTSGTTWITNNHAVDMKLKRIVTRFDAGTLNEDCFASKQNARF